jgi:hypothetical protein
MLPDVYDAFLGNPARGSIGQYTATDAKGNPLGINPATGRYTTNDQFADFKNKYSALLAKRGLPYASKKRPGNRQGNLCRARCRLSFERQRLRGSRSAYRPSWTNSQGLKNALAKVGFSFDDHGNFVQGTGLFDGMQRNSALDRLTSQYLRTRWNERKLSGEEAQAPRVFRREDLKGNAPDTFLSSAPEIMRNSDGSVMRDKNTGVADHADPGAGEEVQRRFGVRYFQSHRSTAAGG